MLIAPAIYFVHHMKVCILINMSRISLTLPRQYDRTAYFDWCEIRSCASAVLMSKRLCLCWMLASG